MAKEHTTDLLLFLSPFPVQVRETALWIREVIWDRFPESNELIYDNYNAVAIGFAPTDKMGEIFCSFAVYAHHVNLGFNRGSELADTKNLLKGSGSLFRHFTIESIVHFPKETMEKLMDAAWLNAMRRLKPHANLQAGKTIVKSISDNKKRPV